MEYPTKKPHARRRHASSADIYAALGMNPLTDYERERIADQIRRVFGRDPYQEQLNSRYAPLGPKAK